MTMSKRAVRSVRQHLGKQVRAYRTQAEISQDALGKLTKCSGKYIGEIERGAKAPTVDVLWRLFRGLKSHGAPMEIGDLFPAP